MCEIGSIIAGGASIIGGIMGNKASRDQASAIQQATNQQSQAIGAAIGDYKRSSPILALMNQYGGEVSGQLADLLGMSGNDPTEMLMKTPGAQFAMQEGMSALENSLGAKNQLYSGKAMKEIQRYGQNFATTLYNQEFDRRMGFLQQGERAASTVLRAVTGQANGAAAGAIGAAGARADATQSTIDGIGGAATALSNYFGKNSGAESIAKVTGNNSHFGGN